MGNIIINSSSIESSELTTVQSIQIDKI